MIVVVEWWVELFEMFCVVLVGNIFGFVEVVVVIGVDFVVFKDVVW